MSQKPRSSIPPASPTAGTARLSIVVLVTVVSLIYSSVLEYGVPLYFNSLGNFPKKMWSSLVVWQVLPWILTPVLAGVLAKRFGECRVWAVSLVGQAIIPPALIVIPHPWIIPPLAFWSGVTGAAAWLSGISLTQVVPPEKKGFANAMMMMSVGVGSVVGPLAARGVLWSHQISGLASHRDWLGIGAFLLNFTPPRYAPSAASFSVIFMGIGILSVLMAAAVWMYGQHAGREVAGIDRLSTPTRADFGRLFSNPTFWGMVLSLSLLGGPVFEATNQFLRYRSEDLGLIAGPIDHGWILMQLMRPLMWLPGGLAVGLLAGKRAPGYVAAFILGCYGLASLGIGLSHSAVALFGTVAGFEFLRQCMRWAQTGYFSEHMPADLRSTAMGWGIALSATGGSIFGFVTNSWMRADAVGFDSSRPFELAALLGLIGATGLFIFDRISPIRRP